MRYPNGLTTEPRLGSDPYWGKRKPIVTPAGTTSGFHTGVDYVGFPTVYAIAAGRVIYADRNASYGNEVRVLMADGVVARYCHLASFARGISFGDEVAEGQAVGVMGSTGLSNGVHLHFRVDRNGISFDPRPYLARGVGGGGSGGGSTDEDIPDPFNLEGLPMDTILIEATDGLNRYKGGISARYFSLWSPSTGRAFKINDPALRNQLARKFGDPAFKDDSGFPTQGFQLGYADWESAHGGTYDPRKP